MAQTDDSFWSRWQFPLLFVIVAALVMAGGYATYAFAFSNQNSADATPVAQEGDLVSVDYIGMFEDGTVFDTSMESVANNDAMYPKSLTFSPKYEYAPLNFTIGSGSMIPGFENGVTGMAVGQTAVLYIPPEEGYGEPDPTLFKTMGIEEKFHVFEWFGNSSEFLDTFQIAPSTGMIVKSPTYGWNVTVYFYDTQSDMVMLRNDPVPGEIVSRDGYWDSKVVSIDSAANMGLGEIIIRHLVSQDIVGSKMFTDSSGTDFIISGLDTTAGTFTLDYNRQVAGKTLVFKVTLVSLSPSA